MIPEQKPNQTIAMKYYCLLCLVIFSLNKKVTAFVPTRSHCSPHHPQPHPHHDVLIKQPTPTASMIKYRRSNDQEFTTTILFSQSQNQESSSSEQEDVSSILSFSSSSSPLMNDLGLIALDTIALLGFAAVGKASHASDGSIDIGAVFITAFPFIASWLVTSPITGVYNSNNNNNDDDSTTAPTTIVDIAKTTIQQTTKGWIVAIPVGCALRGIIKGYIPPTSFVIVTLIATFIILGTVRVIYAIITAQASPANLE